MDAAIIGHGWVLGQSVVGQAAPGGLPGPSASTIFYFTLMFIFVTAIVTTIVTKWSRDKCLKFFNGYHVSLERHRGQTMWGRLKVFASGLEIVYDHPFVDAFGRRKTSFLMYQQDLDMQLLTLLRYHDELSDEERDRRLTQINRTFNPGPLRRLWRGARNLVNTLRDAFNAAIGAVVGQYQRMNPASAVMGSQAGQVTQLGQTLLGKFANAYEPLLEQYIGQPVILDVADPLNPNNRWNEYTGYLADYTLTHIAVFNVEHGGGEPMRLKLPAVDRGDALPPLPAPPPPGGAPPVLPPPLLLEHDMAVRVDGLRMKIQNTRHEPVAARRLERENLEPVELGVVIAPSATLDLPVRDARGGTLVLERIRCLDVLAPRRWATIRHAGELVERRGLLKEVGLDLDIGLQLPQVPLLHRRSASQARTGGDGARATADQPATPPGE
jgi:hypothetical protein